MPTNEERKQVAARLRTLEFTFEDDLEDELCAFYDAIECNLGQKRWEINPYRFLADLIEPEPERKCRNLARGFAEFKCSACDYFQRDMPCSCYCPKCGAKVVEA